MPARALPSPLLSLATSGLAGLKSVDADNLSCMWTVFTKCAENLENGRRLENFSWRLWYREAHFFDDPSTAAPQPVPFASESQSQQQVGSPAEVLSDLSSSVESASDLEDERRHAADQPHDLTTTPANDESHAPPRPCLGRRESSSRRQNVKHLSPESFKTLIESLEPPTAAAEKWKALKKGDSSDEEHTSVKGLAVPELPTLSAALPARKPAVPTDIPAMRPRTIPDAHGSPGNGSGRSLQRVSSSIVRGFTPENPSISRRLAPPDPPQVRDTTVETRKKPKFYIGSSVSDSDEEDAPLTLKSSIKPPSKSNISPPCMKRAPSNGSAKKTHFHEIVDTKILPSPSVEESEDEDEDSAIMSDDDDDDWEDSQSDSGEVQDDHMFDKREDTHLPSRGSMLSTLFKSKSDYNLPSQALKATNAFIRSRTSPALTPRTQTISPAEVSGVTAGIRIPQPTVTGNDAFVQPMPASPRTTRRRMLASELSESLRRNLLWERQHRTMTNNNNTAALKRRHTSNDLARLKDFPEALSTHEATQEDFGKYAFDSGDAVW